MNNKPLVSVLMGIYNCADTLLEAIDSIKNQTYQNWELIMCDDGSTDNTFEVAKLAAESDERIVLLKNEKNLTLAPTLNHCLSVAKGIYIARMDGDDVCDPKRFEKEVRFLESNTQYSLVSTNMNFFDDKGVFRTTAVKDFPNEKDLVKGPPFCHACCMIRKNVLDEVGGYNTHRTVERVEDYDLWFRIYKAGYRGANIQGVLYSMRDDREAIGRRKFKYRINGFNVSKNVIKTFNLPKRYYLKAMRPIIVGLLPTPIYKLLHKIG